MKELNAFNNVAIDRTARNGEYALTFEKTYMDGLRRIIRDENAVREIVMSWALLGIDGVKQAAFGGRVFIFDDEPTLRKTLGQPHMDTGSGTFLRNTLSWEAALPQEVKDCYEHKVLVLGHRVHDGVIFHVTQFMEGPIVTPEGEETITQYVGINFLVQPKERKVKVGFAGRFLMKEFDLAMADPNGEFRFKLGDLKMGGAPTWLLLMADTLSVVRLCELLASPNSEQIINVAPGHVDEKYQRRRALQGKPPLLEHKRVTLKVGPQEIERVLREAREDADEPAFRKRQHPVLGHWRTLRRGTPDERRIWVTGHLRGDPALGRITRENRVVLASPVDA